MNGSPGGPSTTLIYAALVVLIVGRFLFRELRERTIRVQTLWIRPGILAALTALFITAAAGSRTTNPGLLVLALAIGSAVGIGTGLLVAGSTTFAPADLRGAVRARGNAVTVAVWLAALALRLVARYALGGATAIPARQFALNAGLLALVTAAFVVVALAFHRAIDRLAPV